MAEIQTTPGKNKKSTSTANRKRIAVDLTPMVDLGFLLITFFILTTSMSSPAVAKLIMPKDNTDSMKIPAGGALTFLNGSNNNVVYYCGELTNTVFHQCSYNDVRKIILDKKSRSSADDLFITVKPDNDCSYKNMVDMLDEMNISDVKRYAFADMNASEKKVFDQITNAHP